MTSQLQASLFLLFICSFSEILTEMGEMEKLYNPVMDAYCRGRFSAQSDEFLACYLNNRKKEHEDHTVDDLFDVCINESPTDQQIKAFCDTISPSAADASLRETNTKCLVDQLRKHTTHLKEDIQAAADNVKCPPIA